MRQTISRRPGFTMTEMLVALIIVGVIMTGVYGFFTASWQSYNNIIWQNAVDKEARRALDDIVDTVRMSGYDNDMTVPGPRDADFKRNVKYGDSESLEVVRTGQGSDYIYSIQPTSNNSYLTRLLYPGTDTKMVAQYITDIHFEYEYRKLGRDTNEWTLVRTTTPTTEQFYSIKTVYITVTAQHTTDANTPDSRTYSRTLTGAVTIRAPYNVPVPLTQSNGPHSDGN